MSNIFNITPAQAIEGIFTRRYMFKVSQLAFVNPELNKRLGVATTGNKEFDTQLSDLRVVRALTPAQAAMIKNKRFYLALMVPEMALEIYKHLQTHLELWARACSEHALNVIKAPFEDLLVLEEFASALFMVARYYFTPEVTSVSMFSASFDLSKFGLSEVDTMFKEKDPTTAAVQNDEPVNDGYPLRESLAPVFFNAMARSTQ